MGNALSNQGRLEEAAAAHLDALRYLFLALARPAADATTAIVLFTKDAGTLSAADLRAISHEIETVFSLDAINLVEPDGAPSSRVARGITFSPVFRVEHVWHWVMRWDIRRTD